MKKPNQKLSGRYVAALFLALAFAAPSRAAVLPPLLSAITIPGLGISVGTKTIIGWALGLGLLYSAYRTMAAMSKSDDERSKEKRAEDVKWAWITFLSSLAIIGVLTAAGIVSFTDITSGLSAV